jgi:hypothetical protein
LDEPLEIVAIVDAIRSRKDLMDVTGDDGHYRKKRYKGDTLMAMDSGCDVNSNTSTISDKIDDSDSKYNSESD